MLTFPDPAKDKYALLIVNTYQLPNALNDTLVQIVMLLNWGVSLSNIYILADSDKDARLKFLTGMIYKKQRLNIKYNKGSDFVSKYVEILRIIAVRAQSKADVFISISGHGSRVRDRNRDEKDGYDECIIPAGVRILDDHLFSGLLQLGSNFNILTLTDTCHSGTMFDLDSKTALTMKASALSISACGDNQLDWECGCDTTKIKSFLKSRGINDMSSDDVKKYLSYLPSTYITGSLTSAVIDRAFDRMNDESLRLITLDLKSLGQTLNQQTVSKAREIEQSRQTSNINAVTTVNATFYWLVVLIVFISIAVLIFMAFSYRKNIFVVPERVE